jgi:enoyl-CoA hydratase/carnithine racemase
MIRVESQGDVRLITLNRPEKRNAMLPEMLVQLRDAVEQSSDARAVVLGGEGKLFCAGFDLKACAADPSGDTMRALLTGLSSCVRVMRSCEAPIVLAAHGAAVAGGCALLGGADVVITNKDAQLGYPVTRIGVSPAVSAPFMLAAMRSGTVRSRLTDPGLVDGERALKLSMVHEVVETTEAVIERAIEIATTLAAKPGDGCRATKRWLNEISDVSDQRADIGLNGSLALTGGDEERERLAAMWG